MPPLMLVLVVSTSTGGMNAEKALRQAANAYEYRDFEKVRDLLTPWLNPPQFADPVELTQARRLLGISLHVLGDVKGAQRAFSDALEADPNLKLDPFLVPPQVIETFEEIKRKMAPFLETKPQLRLVPRDPPPNKEVKIVEAPPRSMMWLGGIALISEDEPAWGWTWLAAQAVGVAVNIAFAVSALSIDARPATQDLADTRNQRAWISIAGLGLAAGAYVGSVIHADAVISHRRSKIIGFTLSLPLE